jgi:hypothetical protein
LPSRQETIHYKHYPVQGIGNAIIDRFFTIVLRFSRKSIASVAWFGLSLFLVRLGQDGVLVWAISAKMTLQNPVKTEMNSNAGSKNRDKSVSFWNFKG